MKFSIFNSARDNSPKPGDLTWPEFVAMMTPHRFRPAAEKLLCEAFSPATFTTGGTRSNANVEALSMFVADLDGITDQEIEQFTANVIANGWQCLLHTTWSHHHKPNSFRAILPLSRPATPEEWPGLWDQINDALGGYADPACRDAARLYFGAFAPEGTQSSAMHHTFEGVTVSVDAFDYTHPAPIRPANVQITREQLTRFARALLRKRDDRESEKGHILNKILAGEAFAEAGNRDNTIFRLALTLAERFPDADPDSVGHFFAPSLLQMQTPDPIRPDQVADKIRRAQESLQKDRARIERDFEQAQKRAIRDAFASARDTPYTKEEFEALPPSRFIIQKGRAYYARVGDDYRGPYTQDEAQSAIVRDLSPAHPFINIHTITNTGERAPKTLPRLVREFGFVANDVSVSLSAQKAYFAEESRTLIEAPCPLRSIKPKNHPEIHHWLEALAGPKKLPFLLGWIANVTRLDLPCTALFLTGHKHTGKSLLAEGLARLWTPLGLPTPLETVLGTNFNDSQLRCPLVFADERLPTDHRGRVLNAELRHYIQSRRRPLKRKFLPNSDMIGAVRLIISANNEEILSTTENLSNHDIGAIVDRYLHIPVQISAYQYLRAIDASKWVEKDMIAEHALHLRDSYDWKPNGRFIVHANDNALHSRLISSSGIRSAVLQFCVGYLLDPDRADNDARGRFWIRVYNQKLCINTQALIHCWGHYVSNESCPPTGRLSQAINALATAKRLRLSMPGGKRPNFREIDANHLIAWAAQTGFATQDQIEKALEQDTEQRAPDLALN